MASDFFDDSIENEYKCCEQCSNKIMEGNTPYCLFLKKKVPNDHVCLQFKWMIRDMATSILEHYPLEEESKSISKPNKKEGCYIATAVYGSYNAPEVLVLRKFRDKVLYKSVAGKVFIKIYYIISPHISNKLKNNTRINLWIRHRLDKLVNRLEKNDSINK